MHDVLLHNNSLKETCKVISVFLGGTIVWLLCFLGQNNIGENLGLFF